jgi:DNA primase small subunit
LTLPSKEFIYGKFSEFYNSPSIIIPAPTSLGQREVGFLLLKEVIMLRHKCFANINSLKLFMAEAIPSDVYHSCAYYENPTADMERKGWLGADLVFDIDADHIPTSCDKLHDEWACSKCGFNGKGLAPETCPICAGQKFNIKTWPCERCLESAKEETMKLIDILSTDFGFSDNELRVFFSGHRGYHVHVENESIKTLDTLARKEIVDYISGMGHSLNNVPRSKSTRQRGRSQGFSLHGTGWNKRIKLGMRDFILKAKKEDLKNAGIGNYATVLQNRDLMVRWGIEQERWGSVKGISFGTWRKLAEYVKDIESAKIDTVVTTDTHRLIRMNGTLHGKTGLKKVEFPVKRLADFDPFEEAVAFKGGAVKVFVSDAPKFRLGGSGFGPYKEQTVEVPTAVAVLLICKGRAEVAT